jgi:serine/threonine protein kinase
MITCGVYGKIYKTDHPHRVKKMFGKDPNYTIRQDFVREATIYRMIEHSKYIPKVENIVVDDTDISEYICMEKFDGHIDIKNGYTSDQIRNIIYSIVCALYDMHTLGISHRDIKPSNVLQRGDDIRLCDFGISRINLDFGAQNITSDIQTMWYRAPEVILFKNSYDCKIDMWSVGVMIYELCNRKYMMQSSTTQQHIRNIFSICGVPKKEAWPGLADTKIYESLLKLEHKHVVLNTADADLKDLAERLLVTNPDDRSSVFDIINHDYFKKSPKFVHRERRFIMNEYIRLLSKFDMTGVGKTITFEIRKDILTDYVTNIKKAGLKYTTIFYSIHLIDRYVSLHQDIDIHNYRLLCYTCLTIASKIYDMLYIDIEYINQLTKCEFSEDELMVMEITVLNIFNCDLFIPDEYTFLKIIKKILDIDDVSTSIITDNILVSILSDPDYRKHNMLENVVNIINKYYKYDKIASFDDLMNKV